MGDEFLLSTIISGLVIVDSDAGLMITRAMREQRGTHLTEAVVSEREREAQVGRRRDMVKLPPRSSGAGTGISTTRRHSRQRNGKNPQLDHFLVIARVGGVGVKG